MWRSPGSMKNSGCHCTPRQKRMSVASIPSNIGTIAIAKQSAKGTAAAAPTVKFALCDPPDISPLKETARYTMTDTGPDQGPAYTTRMGVSGSFPVYLHYDGFALLAYLIQGSNADAGATPNYTHTATPADTLPYCTIWRSVGNVLFEKYTDCKVNTLRIESSAGQPAKVMVAVEGILSNFLASDTVLARLTSPGLLHMEAKGAFMFGGTARKLHQLTLELNRNVAPYQADDYLAEQIDEGQRVITMSFATRFGGATAFPDYRQFYYASDAGTDLSPAIGTQAFEVTFTRDVNSSVDILLPQLKYAAIPVHADPGGAPIDVEVSCEVEKPAGSPICTIVTKDQTASV